MKKRFLNGLKEAVIISVVAGIILGLGWGLSRRTEARKSYTPTNLIRLHIIGNSDDPIDQEVKLKVRDAILSTLGENLISVNNVKDAEKIILENLGSAEKTAVECLKESGMDYGAKVRLTRAYFPGKTYRTQGSEEVFLPEGEYEALQIILGAGKGQNWWCIVYPTLCYSDLIKSSVPENLLEALREEKSPNTKFLVDELLKGKTPLEIRFFFADVLKKGLKAFWAILPRSFLTLGKP